MSTLLRFNAAGSTRSPQQERFFVSPAYIIGAVALVTFLDHKEASFELPATPDAPARNVKRITLATPALTDAQLRALPQHVNILIKRIQQGESQGFTDEKILKGMADFAAFYNMAPAAKQEEYRPRGTPFIPGGTTAPVTAGNVNAAEFDLTV